jgi:predicted membrane protein
MKYLSAALAIVFASYILWSVLRHGEGISSFFALAIVLPVCIAICWFAIKAVGE